MSLEPFIQTFSPQSKVEWGKHLKNCVIFSPVKQKLNVSKKVNIV